MFSGNYDVTKMHYEGFDGTAYGYDQRTQYSSGP